MIGHDTTALQVIRNMLNIAQTLKLKMHYITTTLQIAIFKV